MAKWILLRSGVPGPIDYPGLGFSARPGDVYSGDSAPDAYWHPCDAGTSETVDRYMVPGGDDAAFAALIDDAGSDVRASLSATYVLPEALGSPHAASHSRESLEPTIVNYLPGSVTQVQTPTNQTWADIDATNLKVSFVCPPSGKVKVTLSACAVVANDQGLMWRLKDNATSGINSSTLMVANETAWSNATSYTRSVVVSVDGAGAALVPGRLYTFVWQHRALNVTAFAATEYGGAANDGPAVIEVQPISNRVTQKTVSAVVETAPNWHPWDVDVDNLKMVGAVGAGDPSRVGRIAYSSNAGTSWAYLNNLVTPAGTNFAWFAGDGEILVQAGIVGGGSPAPGKIYKSSGWATNPLTATFSAVLTANNLGSANNVYFGNYAGVHQFGGICVINEYGPKTSASMARYVYVTENHGATWRSIFDLRAFILAEFPSWDGNDAHVHGSVYDPWWDCVWVVTGDYDGAGTLPYTLVSFNWRTTNPTWHKVYTRHQFTSIIPMPGCILFGTDQGSSAADGFGNGLLRLRRTHPSRVKAGVQVLEGALIYDTGAGISVIGKGFSRHAHNHDAPTLIEFGESGASGPTGRIVATHDGFTFKELWTASDTGTTGSVGRPVAVGSTITAPYQSSLDSFEESLVTLTLT